MSLELITNKDIKTRHNVMHSVGQDPLKKAEHEWIFVRLYLYTKELLNEPSAEEFVSFQETFFPKYKWMWPKDYWNMSKSVIMETGFCDYVFEKKYRYNEWTKEDYEHAMAFGDLMTEYMIRTKGFSLITTDIRKSIITAEQNCAKKFGQYIEDGYQIHRLAKAIYKPSRVELFGKWETLPVFPTNSDNLSCEAEEFIENKNKQLVKVSK